MALPVQYGRVWWRSWQLSPLKQNMLPSRYTTHVSLVPLALGAK
jgi:hypothetical protein